MKILLIVFLIVIRFIIGFKIMFWLVQEFRFPEEHSFVEIEFYLVLLLFDIWISLSNVSVGQPQNEENKD